MRRKVTQLKEDRNVGELVQASVARRLRTPPNPAKGKDLSFGLGYCLRSNCDRSTVVICNYTFCTDNGGDSPSKS